jgi:hypothetical protein
LAAVAAVLALSQPEAISPLLLVEAAVARPSNLLMCRQHHLPPSQEAPVGLVVLVATATVGLVAPAALALFVLQQVVAAVPVQQAAYPPAAQRGRDQEVI